MFSEGKGNDNKELIFTSSYFQVFGQCKQSQRFAFLCDQLCSYGRTCSMPEVFPLVSDGYGN